MSKPVEHPYYPSSLELPLYVSNDRDLVTVVGSFLAGWTVIWTSSLFLINRKAPGLTITEKATTLWFVTCGFLHIVFEGYFILNYNSMAGKQDLFAQLWKEYALSDSRYLSGDNLVLCAEAVTVACWGPLSFLAAMSIIRDSAWRYPVQLLLSTGHAFGDLLYLASSFMDLYRHNRAYSRPEAYYLWFYFFGLNAIWLIIPSCMCCCTVRGHC